MLFSQLFVLKRTKELVFMNSEKQCGKEMLEKEFLEFKHSVKLSNGHSSNLK